MDIDKEMGEIGFYNERPRYHEDIPGIAMIQVPYIGNIDDKPSRNCTTCSIIYPYSSQHNLLGYSPTLRNLSRNMKENKTPGIIFENIPEDILNETNQFLGDLYLPINSQCGTMWKAIDMTRRATELFLRYLAGGSDSNFGAIPYLNEKDLMYALREIPGFTNTPPQ